MQRIRRCVAAAALALATPAAAAPPMYVATLIPPVGGGHFNAPTGINAAGQVVGWSHTMPLNWSRAFVFSGGFVFDLGTPDGMPGSSASGINRHGQVVGAGYTQTGAQAFIFSGGAMSLLPIGAPCSTAAAINDRGQVVGQYEQIAGAARMGYLLSAGNLVTIPGLMPNGVTQPNSINAKGEVTGHTSVPGGGNFAFLYSGGTTVGIAPPNAFQVSGMGINDATQVAGAAGFLTGGNQAFLFSSGVLSLLGWLVPQTDSGAFGINNPGQVIGYSTVATQMYTHAFLRDGGVMYDLNDYLLTDLQGRELVDAVAINDSGQIAARACNFNFTNCVAVRLDPFLPGPATVTGAGGDVTVTGGTYVNGILTLTEATSEIRLPTTVPAFLDIHIHFAGMNFAPGTRLTIRAGAPGQRVSLSNSDGKATTISGTIVAAGNVGGTPPPHLIVDNWNGIAIAADGSISAPSGLTLLARGATGGIVNQGSVDGGTSLVLEGSWVNGSGAYRGDTVFLSTSGNVNNPVHGLHFLANGLRVLPSTGGTVALTLNGYGSAPQVFNVRVEGNAVVSMPSLWPAGSNYPFLNNPPVLPGGFRPAGVPDPAYGGGSLIVQATGGLTLDGGVSHDFVFPGGLVLVAGGSLDFNGVTVDNGWTTTGQAWQGMFFEAPVITSSAGPIDTRASDNNWINFNVKPNVGVRAWQLKRVAGGAAQFATADSVAPHLNTYSTQVEIAADGGCWTCTVNPDPVDMY